jgi:hypothetical protein
MKNLSSEELEVLLCDIDACVAARHWAEGKTAQQMWDECPRGDWLLWLIKRLGNVKLPLLTKAKGLCAKTVYHLMKDARSRNAVDAAIAFGNGNITRAELDAAAAAAYAAATADDAAAYADDAAAAAAYAAATADDAAAYAAAYAAAAAAAAADAARTKNRLETAAIVRSIISLDLI